MNILITGGAGFVARHLVQEISELDCRITLADQREPQFPFDSKRTITSLIDLRSEEAVTSLINRIRPDFTFHLAALSHVGKAWQDRGLLFDLNVAATANLCKALASLNSPTKLLFASSAMVYDARAVKDLASGFSEETPTCPANPYGESKLAAEYVVRTFASPSFKPFIVRPFNHIGPGQSEDFVCSSFAAKIVRAKSGDKIKVGNMAAQRDFSDVRDVVRAYRLIMEKNPTSDLFVLGRGIGVSVQEILDAFIVFSKKTISAEVDPSLLRPYDPPLLIANSARAKDELNWVPQIQLHETLKGIYEDAEKKWGQKS